MDRINGMTEAEMIRLHELTRKFFRTAPGRVKEVFTAEEVALLKQHGIITKPRGRKVANEDAAAWGAAYTALSR